MKVAHVRDADAEKDWAVLYADTLSEAMIDYVNYYHDGVQAGDFALDARWEDEPRFVKYKLTVKTTFAITGVSDE